MKKRFLILLVIVLVAAVLLACGTAGSMCYSTYPGCEETAVALATEWAR